MQSRLAPTLPTALAALASSLLIACGEPPGPPNLAPQDTPQVSVVTIAPQRVVLETDLPGRVSPALIAEVRPQVTGIVQSRRFREGSEVKAGELLYQIDPATYRAALDSAQAALSKAEANLVTVRLKAGRYKELSEIKAISQQDADDAAALLLQADAEVASARASLQSQRINLDYTRVVAPIGGRVGRSSVTPGALVTANQATALATVQRLDPIYVDVSQSSTALHALRRSLASGEMKGGTAKVKLLLEDGTAYPLEGRLQFSEVEVNQSTGAVTLRAEFPNPHGELLPGMYARAVIEEGVLEKAILAPQPAVTRDTTGRPRVSVVDAAGKLQLRNITTERAIGDQWLVGSGLAAGDRLVVEGGQKAQPGMAVDAKPRETAEKPRMADPSGNSAVVKTASTEAASRQP